MDPVMRGEHEAGCLFLSWGVYGGFGGTLLGPYVKGKANYSGALYWESLIFASSHIVCLSWGDKQCERKPLSYRGPEVGVMCIPGV